MKHSIGECIPFWASLCEKHKRRLQDNAIFRSYKKESTLSSKRSKRTGSFLYSRAE